MFFAVLRMECAKVFKRKLPWIGMGIVITVFLFYFSILFEAIRQKSFVDTFSWPAGITSGSSMVVSPLPIASMGIFLSLIVAAGSTAQEYGWHSLQLWLSQGVSRHILFFAKIAVCFMTALLIAGGGMLTGVITSVIAALQLHRGIDLAQVNLLQFFIAWLRLTYSIMPYTLLAFMLAIVFRSTIPAIGIGLAFAALLEMFMLPLSRSVPAAREVWSFMPLSLAASLDHLNVAVTSSANSVEAAYKNLPIIDPGLAALLITCYILIFIGIAYVVFARQNMNG